MSKDSSQNQLHSALIVAAEHMLDDNEKALIADHQWIPAIKALRARIGCGLCEGKMIVEAYQDSGELRKTSAILNCKEVSFLLNVITHHPDFNNSDSMVSDIYRKLNGR